MSLPMPPENSSLPASDSATAVTGNSVSMKSMAAFCRLSHSCERQWVPRADMRAYPNVSVVGPADEQLLAAPADIHCVDHLLVSCVAPYPRLRLCVPAREHHVCGRGEYHARVSRPMQVQDCTL